jgi:hypothetical protein
MQSLNLYVVKYDTKFEITCLLTALWLAMEVAIFDSDGCEKMMILSKSPFRTMGSRH